MSADWTFPPVPAEIKALAPFFQRAQELKVKDPVMAYWCTYYAAKQAISSKVQSKDARPFLFQVLTVLEEMKAALAHNDAVSDDDVGAAYIENFALRVFAMADNEDRKGKATRSTAKKFLAAANFFELIHIFDKPIEADITEKIRYSKWKAADIAKAFREGRQPMPGDAQQQNEPPATLEPPSGMSAWSPGTTSPAFISPAPRENVPLPPEAQAPITPPRPAFERKLHLHDNGYATPGMWSTVATPGTEDVDRSAGMGPAVEESPSERAAARRAGLDVAEKPGVGEDDAWSTVANTPMSRQGSWTAASETHRENTDTAKWADVDARTSSPVPVSAPAPKKVHFSPSVVGGLSSTTSSIAGSSPPGSPERFTRTLTPVPEDVSPPQDPMALPLPDSETSAVVSPRTPREQQIPSPKGSDTPLPQHRPTHPPHIGSISIPPQLLNAPQPLNTPPQLPSAPPQLSSAPPQVSSAPRQLPSAPPQVPSAPPQVPSAPPQVPSAPPQFPSTPPRFPTIPPPPMPSGGLAGQPPSPPSLGSTPHAYALRAGAPPPRRPPPPPELTSTEIAKVQKHCKFAISALDYEDVDTARKELLAALAMLSR